MLILFLFNFQNRFRDVMQVFLTHTLKLSEKPYNMFLQSVALMECNRLCRYIKKSPLFCVPIPDSTPQRRLLAAALNGTR